MVDTVTLEIVNNRLDEIVQKMQYSIFRTGYSTVIRESKDTSASITTRDGRVVGQQFRHPFHIGVFPPAVEAIFEYFDEGDIRDGDIFIMNDPYIGGSPHASDIIVANPVFVDDEIVAFTLNIAHKPDIGGLVPGTSSGEARELYHEGIQFPPVKVESAGKPNEDITNILRNNSRDPDVTVGDLRGQIGCTKVGKDELLPIFEEYGKETVLTSFDELIESLHRQVVDRLDRWPIDTVEGEAFMDIPKETSEWTADLSTDERIRIHLAVRNEGDQVVFDFTGTDDQTIYPINFRPNLVRGICYYALIGLLDPSLALNSGIAEACKIVTRQGSVLEPNRPAPVNFYIYPVNVVSNLILRTLSGFDPEQTATADAGGNLGFSFGSTNEKDGDASVQYEFLFSGYGGSAHGDGATGVASHANNLEIAPIEVVETEFPNRVDRFQLIPDSEGAGEFRGSFGIRREYTVQDDVTFVYRPKTSNVYPPQGVAGGHSPEIAAGCYIYPEDGNELRLPTITPSRKLDAGTTVRLEIHGSGGYGDPLDRDADRILTDYLNGFITAERAASVYGVEIDTESDRVVDSGTDPR